MKTMRNVVAVLALGGLLIAPAGCASWGNTEKGAVIGAATGAAVGGVVGAKLGSTAKGAIAGAAVGGVAGAIIGRQMDQQAEDLAGDLEGAEVERVGEGIAVKFDSGLLFDFDQATLRQEARENLGELAASLQDNPQTNVLIVGHTDAKGTDAYNQELSERRAAAAANYLTTRGIAPSRIRAVGRGEAEPIAENTDEWGRQQNRRVEVAIFASEELRREAMQQAGL